MSKKLTIKLKAKSVDKIMCLILDDATTKNINQLESTTGPNFVIKWELDNNSGIDSITDITLKVGSINIFKKGPHLAKNGKDWRAVVGGKIASFKECAYNIEYVVGGKTYLCDPIIIVDPDI